MTFYIIMVAISYFSLCVCVKKNEKKWKKMEKYFEYKSKHSHY